MNTEARTHQSPLVPRLSRITKNLQVAVPDDCWASVILKEVTHDAKGRYYLMQLMVGRYDISAMSADYTFTGVDTVRCDIPVNGLISAAAIRPHLAAFLASEGKLPDGPPVIIGSGEEE